MSAGRNIVEEMASQLLSVQVLREEGVVLILEYD